MITKNYIKMCEKAKEIQKAWKPVDWDKFIYKDDGEMGIACVDEEPMNKETMKEINKKYIYLPTQEQLQEIYGYKMPIHKIPFMERPYYLISKLHDFEYVNKYEDMNELWLAFVMYEKYNKVWNGKDWE